MKRPLPPDDEDNTREFKLRKKSLGVGLGEIYDPGKLTIPLKVKKQEPTEETSTPPSTSASATSQPSKQKWIKQEWSTVEPEELGPDFDPTISSQNPGVKEEEPTIPKEEVKPTIDEDAAHSAPTFIKKRRPAGHRTAGRREL